ncbi:hypothetical protein E2493_17195 [Sphingomonas parva]|uniref:Uncharacterized protein n=1 Tax=Sphingomonas parva TaxID=2555898 RepID=A0A4Y8ZQC4_9SPHN|nr:hypothetical protein [Sphingomonas parva]TFI57029.1 hypothetical protein E2493_17195 [Sphingomonas parva]
MAEDGFDTQDFDTPITEFLDGPSADRLTAKAKTLIEGDLVALAWRNSTERTETLSWRDIVSIEDAFKDHPFRGDANSETVGASCCCTCTPACCCTAAAVVTC